MKERDKQQETTVQFRKGNEKKRKETQTKITETEKIKMSFQTKHTHTVDQIRSDSINHRKHRTTVSRFETTNVNGMEWNGMEWNGMEWNGMEWFDVHRPTLVSFRFVSFRSNANIFVPVGVSRCCRNSAIPPLYHMYVLHN
jgi:DNA polymerase elongation subunit (family B)